MSWPATGTSISRKQYMKSRAGRPRRRRARRALAPDQLRGRAATRIEGQDTYRLGSTSKMDLFPNCMLEQLLILLETHSTIPYNIRPSFILEQAIKKKMEMAGSDFECWLLRYLHLKQLFLPLHFLAQVFQHFALLQLVDPLLLLYLLELLLELQQLVSLLVEPTGQLVLFLSLLGFEIFLYLPVSIVDPFEAELPDLPLDVLNDPVLLLLLLDNVLPQFQFLGLQLFFALMLVQNLLLHPILFLNSIDLFFLGRPVFLVNFHLLQEVLVICIAFVNVFSQIPVLNFCYQLLCRLFCYLICQQLLHQHIVGGLQQQGGLGVVNQALTMRSRFLRTGAFILFGIGQDWPEIAGVVLFLAGIDINELLAHIKIIAITNTLQNYQKYIETHGHSWSLGTKLALMSLPKWPSFSSLICKCSARFSSPHHTLSLRSWLSLAKNLAIRSMPPSKSKSILGWPSWGCWACLGFYCTSFRLQSLEAYRLSTSLPSISSFWQLISMGMRPPKLQVVLEHSGLRLLMMGEGIMMEFMMVLLLSIISSSLFTLQHLSLKSWRESLPLCVLLLIWVVALLFLLLPMLSRNRLSPNSSLLSTPGFFVDVVFICECWTFAGSLTSRQASGWSYSSRGLNYFIVTYYCRWMGLLSLFSRWFYTLMGTDRQKYRSFLLLPGRLGYSGSLLMELFTVSTMQAWLSSL